MVIAVPHCKKFCCFAATLQLLLVHFDYTATNEIQNLQQRVCLVERGLMDKETAVHKANFKVVDALRSFREVSVEKC